CSRRGRRGSGCSGSTICPSRTIRCSTSPASPSPAATSSSSASRPPTPGSTAPGRGRSLRGSAGPRGRWSGRGTRGDGVFYGAEERRERRGTSGGDERPTLRMLSMRGAGKKVSASSASLRVLCGSSVAVAVLFAAGCRQDMHDQPKYRPLRGSAFFADHRSARPLVPGTVARGMLRDESPLYTGKVAGQFTADLPVPLDEALLRRGRFQFETYCAPCHGRVARGDGLVVSRGFKAPTSFHVDRLRQMP